MDPLEKVSASHISPCPKCGQTTSLKLWRAPKPHHAQLVCGACDDRHVKWLGRKAFWLSREIER